MKRVKTFTEKPDHETALSFIESGDFVWNAGIFIWSLKSINKAFCEHLPGMEAQFATGAGKYGTPEESDFVTTVYADLENVSIDYGIMEKAKNVYTVVSDFGWSDLGTWASLHAEHPKDENGNALQGNVIALDTYNTLVRISEGKLAVVKDLHDYIVVDTPDALLIYPKSKEQEVKQVTALVKAKSGEKHL